MRRALDDLVEKGMLTRKRGVGPRVADAQVRRRVALSSLFFVQAEDGIRDVAVTGVQTCALPISTRACRLDRQPIELAAQPLELFGRASWRDGPGGDPVRRRGPRPAAQDERQDQSRCDNEHGGQEVARQIEPTLGRRHENRDAVLAHELVDDLLPGHSPLRQPDHVLVHRWADRAGEVRGPAGVHVEIATARAVELLLDRLDGGVIVGGVDGLEGPPRTRRVPEAARGSGARERIRSLKRCSTPRRHDAKETSRTERQELAPINVQRGVMASVHGFSPTNRTAYPACARFAAGEPPGHMTISPPSATIIPPYHTHHTSGLMVNRNTACSVPFTTPPSTT